MIVSVSPSLSVSDIAARFSFFLSFTSVYYKVMNLKAMRRMKKILQAEDTDELFIAAEIKCFYCQSYL